jgi:hypothetical protein
MITFPEDADPTLWLTENFSHVMKGSIKLPYTADPLHRIERPDHSHHL